MKPHPRIRKAIKWGGAVLTVLFVAVWVWGAWWSFRWTGRSGSCVAIWMNQLEVSHTIVPSGSRMMDEGFMWYDLSEGGTPPYFTPGFRWGNNPNYGWYFAMPMWLPAIAVFLLTLVAWRTDTLARRRARLNLCPKCGYDRTGLARDTKCPECGSGGTPA